MQSSDCYKFKIFTEHRFMFTFLTSFFLKTSKTKFILNICMSTGTQIPADTL